MGNKKRTHLLLLVLMLLCFQVQSKAQDDSTYTEIPVGVILNMRSWVGKTVHSSITIALSEFYKVNSHYQTRIVVHNRDTQGETLHGLHTGQELQSNLSRFVVIVWLFVVLVLTSSYTATLSSLLTIEQIQLASNRNSIGYSYAILRGGINNFTPGTRLQSYSTLEAYADDLSHGSKKGGVDAIVDEIPYIKAFLAEYPSGYSMTISEATTNGFGFAFARGSPWAPKISRQIAKLREDGTLNKLENKWFNQESRDTVPPTKILSLKDMRGLFLISGVSMAAAVFLFMLYLVHEKLHFSCMMPARGGLAFIMRFLLRNTGNAVD